RRDRLFPPQALRAHLPPPPPLSHHRRLGGDPDAPRRPVSVRVLPRPLRRAGLNRRAPARSVLAAREAEGPDAVVVGLLDEGDLRAAVLHRPRLADDLRPLLP